MLVKEWICLGTAGSESGPVLPKGGAGPGLAVMVGFLTECYSVSVCGVPGDCVWVLLFLVLRSSKMS